MSSHRILYVGADITLLGLLNDALRRFDCFVVRCPCPLDARVFLKSSINYSLLLFDDRWADTEIGFARTLKHRESTPVVILQKPDDFAALVETVRLELYI